MPKLILVPTSLECQQLTPLLTAVANQNDWRIEVIGFGPIAAASTTATLIQQHQPTRICLIGIAGRYDTAISLGSAISFSSVSSYGVGVGTGDQYVGATKMGWPMIEESSTHPAIDETISLDSSGSSGTNCLLTCCAASADHGDTLQRLLVQPDAIAEDMEGFGVALSCKLANVPLTIVRGISNIAGDRNHANWKINQALDAAADLAIRTVLGATNV